MGPSPATPTELLTLLAPLPGVVGTLLFFRFSRLENEYSEKEMAGLSLAVGLSLMALSYVLLVGIRSMSSGEFVPVPIGELTSTNLIALIALTTLVSAPLGAVLGLFWRWQYRHRTGALVHSDTNLEYLIKNAHRSDDLLVTVETEDGTTILGSVEYLDDRNDELILRSAWKIPEAVDERWQNLGKYTSLKEENVRRTHAHFGLKDADDGDAARLKATKFVDRELRTSPEEAVVEGVLKNVSEDWLVYVQVTAEFYDGEECFLEASTATFSMVRKRKCRRFEIAYSGDTPDKVSSYKLSRHWVPGTN